ncbi:MAG: hypothetical protein KIS76_15375, partial [Pyrinomonadaceae bacterium]|nr:hypothetical protein [Pyrinomonadaceae bacterium]
MKIKKLFTLKGLLLTPVVLLLMFVSANAATFVVNDTNDVQDATPGDGVCETALGNGVCTLRAAITESNALAGADIITLPAGTYTTTLTGSSENNNASGDFDINSDITINGAGSGTTFVQAAASRGVAVERVFHIRFVTPGTTAFLNDLTVRYGRYTTAAGTFGAGIRVDTGAANATLNRVVVTENDNGSSGGGIAVSGSNGATVTLNNCTVSNNTAGGTAAGSSTGAGIMGNNTTSTININNSSITGNTVSNTSTTVAAVAGGVSSVGTLNVTDSMITNNTATSSGSNTFSGGVHVTAGTTTITGSTISGNASTVTAGVGNGFAGGIYNQQATVSIINSTVSGNSASSFHAGVRTLASTSAAATTNITNSTVSGNTSVGEGGGVINISGSGFNATTNITGSTISGNMATSATSIGGGIEQFTTSTGLGTVNLINSTVSGNSANNAAGIYNSGTAATINSNFSTIASNAAATNGGGLFQDTNGTTNLKNSIVGDNNAGSAGPDIFGAITSQDYNHVEDISGGTFFTEFREGSRLVTTTFFTLPNDVTGTDPQLGPLANNGGTTLTHLPGSASPVVNTIPSGANDCGTVITSSQNGQTRPQQSACEKGSVEIPFVAVPTLSINDVSMAEGDSGTTNFVFTVSMSISSASTVTVDYATVDGTAISGSDYAATSGTLSFAPGNLTKTITVLVSGDLTVEPDEMFFVDLSMPSGATISDGQGMGTIQNDDSAEISIDDVIQLEGNSGTSTFAFTVSLSRPSSQTVTVDYATTDGTATAGSDYIAGSGTLTFLPGDTSKMINVTVNGDTDTEPDETFFVNLSNSSGAPIGDAQGQGTIQNDDSVPAISINDVSIGEGNSGTRVALFDVTLSSPSSQTVSVTYATADGTASALNDYIGVPPTVLSFAPGETTKQIGVTIVGDTVPEPNETFFVNLTAPSGATILDNQGIGTIENDDFVSLSIDDVTVTEGNAGTTNATFTVSLSA